ncbi:hypothetical protein Tco_0769210 [Tanacetum coccineum]|uniref:Uncharacterized protein n=1 Tax=Tanacetum coccineum TaxID=301880 RepID=A0ABQ4Z8S0_9ASTR
MPQLVLKNQISKLVITSLRGRPIGSKDKNPHKRKGTEKNSGHDDNVLNETQDIKTSPEEEMNDINKEMSINYSQTHILWDRNEIGDIDEIFSYSVASDIMSGDDDPEPKSTKSVHSLVQKGLWNGIKHIFRYLRGTTDLGLFYSNNSKQGLVGYADSSYLFDPLQKLDSQTGYKFLNGGHCIFMAYSESIL